MSPDDARRLRELLEGKSRADGFSTRDAEYDPLARDPSAAALDGFAAARLRGRGGAARLAYDLLRWMVVCVHPPNAQLKNGLVQRWELAAALIAAGAEGEATPPASPTAAMEDDAPSAAAAPPVALALVVELLGHAKGETVMHVEPAALLLARAAAAPPARHAGARRSAEAVFSALRSAIDGGLGGLAPPDALGDAVGRALRHARQLRVVSTLDPVRQLALSLGARLPIDGMSQALAEAVALVTSDGIETLLARASAAPPQPEAAATSTVGTVDLGQFGSAVELQALGMEALKAELTRRGCVGGAREWRYERAAQPRELLVHFDGRGGVCDHIGRPHRRNNIMVTVDVLNGVAWQRCWDDECRRGRDGAHVKARSLLAAPPASAVPCAEALRGAVE